ncbi:MAG: rod shape-determining protein MreC [Candidatus Buchananbacteria bacterium RIFCSPHIGHO2_01_FULL_47_11b]|uniref:Cell shape-determining protein MreC n=1 Tax=Candidatus Buchananbacteria bacterium RIFCSPHIGHO2_01_FULL_47_11b TaxID=1797537 RepID=A0A1G1Y738_9BACT|nr:MAG: rod shape-determining protein MreC [Candidatus Buchananbacteria bacterium RIFCSPHIGHO2_01_FULL_47_11b]
MRFLLRKPNRTIVILGAVVLLAVLHYAGPLQYVEDGIIRLLSPLQVRMFSAGVNVNSLYDVTVSKSELLSQREELTSRVGELLAENAQLKTTLAEFEESAFQRSYLTERNLTAVEARVVGKTIDALSHVVILDKGSRDGVRLGTPAITKNGLLVGTVIDLNNSTSKLLLITDTKSSIAALIENDRQTRGIVAGDRGLSLAMDLIPEDEPIAIGEIIVTAGLEATIPRGLVLGEVERVERDPNSFFQRVLVKQLINFDRLTIVSLLITPNE